MDTKTNISRLSKIDELILKGLSEEVIIIKSIYSELEEGLKQVKTVL